jgi:hypothetical protein
MLAETVVFSSKSPPEPSAFKVHLTKVWEVVVGAVGRVTTVVAGAITVLVVGVTDTWPVDPIGKLLLNVTV